jgi:hypothetical protein
MRRVIVVAAAVVLLAGCSSSSSGADSSGGASASTASSGATPSSADRPDGAFALVGQDLGKEGAQVILDAAVTDTTVVASVLSQTSADDYDAGLVFSADGGSSWKWGGVITDPGRTFPEGVAVSGQTAMIVGTNQVGQQDPVVSQAFIALATAPEFVPSPLPAAESLAGTNVHLQDVTNLSGVWLVVGWEQGVPDAAGNAPRTSYLWRSSDDGKTWAKQAMEIPGSTDNSLEQIVIAADGSWNIIGQAVFGDGANQYDPIWLRSVDAGATFQLTNQDVFSAPLDQGATRIDIAGDGSAAILGWDEVTDGNAARASALWVSGPDQVLKRIGTTEVPVSGGTPPGEFISGVLWKGADLTAWGSATGAYPMDNVQFWSLGDNQLIQSAMLPGDGTPLAVSRILTLPGYDLAFGFRGKDLASADAAIWKGTAIN